MALRLMGQWLGRGAYHWPSYRTHASAFPEGAGDINSGTAALLLANPNNPDGRIVARDDLRDWHDRLMRRDGWLVVDEAFADAAPQRSVQGRAMAKADYLALFGKFFGLAGLRLGFVLAPPEVTAMLRAILGDWPLSAGAIAMGARPIRCSGSHRRAAIWRSGPRRWTDYWRAMG
jgi:cobalamin biosynthetic protein CobC